jgi:N-acetylmuramoyl-L-alanine amidase
LNNVAMPAIAIEIAPLTAKISDLYSPAYQQLVAEAITSGIEAIHDQLGAGR